MPADGCVIKTKNFPFGLNPNAETGSVLTVTTFLPAELVTVKIPEETVTCPKVEEEWRPSTRGFSNGPVLVQPHVGAGRLLAITIGRFKLVTPPALVLVITKVNPPREADPEATTVRIAETWPLEGTVRLVGERVNVTPEGEDPAQPAPSCTISLAPLTDPRVICEVVVEEGISARDWGDTEAVKPRLGAFEIERLNDFVTPLAFVPVIVKVNSPGEGAMEVEKVRIVETGPVEGTVRLVGVSVKVTPLGTAPLQAALSCTVSLTPLTDRKVICDVFVEEANSARDGGEAERVKLKLSTITIEMFTDFVTPLELLPVMVKVFVPNDGDAEVDKVRVVET